MPAVSTYSSDLPINQKIRYVLSLLKKATADEITMEIMELQGISTEEGVAALTIEITEALDKMQQSHHLKKVTEPDKKTYFFLPNS
ncbi:MAG: hypothetical protein ACTHJ5_18780 [Ilyomonas sp.]